MQKLDTTNHDLVRLLEALNQAYFDGTLHGISISWMLPRNARKPRKSMHMGWYYPDKREIRIHAVLNRPWVPQYYVMWIIFHEMLHDVYPAGEVNGKRVWHTRDFLAAESRYVHRERATVWEMRNIHRLLKVRFK